MDPNVYLNYNRFQSELSKKFCEELVGDSNWCETRLGTVMDIGCGPGNTSTHWIDHYFPGIERLIGIDIDPGMIDLANKKNTNKKIKFHIADIMDKESLKEWEGTVDRIISTYVLHRVCDQNQAFRNVFDLLKSSGKASLEFSVRGPFYYAFMDLRKTPKWKSFFEATNLVLPESIAKNHGKEFYKQMFEDLGFSVPFCETRQVDFAYQSDEECKNLLLSLHFIGEVSAELKAEYKEDLFQLFLKYSPRDSEGRPTHNAIVLYAKLVKNDCMTSDNGKKSH